MPTTRAVRDSRRCSRDTADRRWHFSREVSWAWPRRSNSSGCCPRRTASGCPMSRTRAAVVRAAGRPQFARGDAKPAGRPGCAGPRRRGLSSLARAAVRRLDVLGSEVLFGARRRPLHGFSYGSAPRHALGCLPGRVPRPASGRPERPEPQTGRRPQASRLNLLSRAVSTYHGSSVDLGSAPWEPRFARR